MRNYILIIITACFITSCSSQSNQISVWLPEKYIEAVLASDTMAFEYLIPLEGIIGSLDSCYILTYKGELTPVKLRPVFIEGSTKYQLSNLQYYMNLKYNSRKEVESYSKSRIYFSEVGKKILMEIVWSDKKEAVYFVDRHNDYIFSKINKDKKYIKSLKD